MNWTEVQIKATSELEDVVSGILYDVGANGLAIEDPKDVLDLMKSKRDWDFIDSSLMDPDLDGILIKAYFSESEDLESIIKEIKDRIHNNPQLSNGKCTVTTNVLDDNDWAESWKKYYKPIRIGENIIIKPSWENYNLLETDIMIELDPGMAFGTGTHETTMMCTEALEKYLVPGSTVYDIGCGSGILSIVSAKLGARKVVGVDLDELCVNISNKNITLNHVDDIVEIKNGNLLDVVEGKADVIVSNIIAEVIAGMTKDLKSYLNNNGIFITSGIIIDKIELVEKALLENEFKILDIMKKNDWACIIATNIS
ncbi:50S ribosomal protein L11 methyltransferase [Tissierella sp.]|uniref:50S ribosomal protein L11 methyltransferase n=1 Tax=Tissierella sp. TaxID=41274 RepID=UPI00285E96E3|nr:50S ribosomal protein L11 methyltransferase [Tissierella sp.]MDR7857109.1 50S ribosomal protein L11 methyltransferase [Tissierella sp.]